MQIFSGASEETAAIAPELIEIRAFLERHPPFEFLPDEVLDQAVRAIEITYRRAGSVIFDYGDTISQFYLIRSGTVEIYRRNGELYNRLDEGDVFGQYGLLMNNRVRLPARALSDTLLYCLPEYLFSEYCERFEEFSDFVEIEGTSRLRQAVATSATGGDLTSVRLETLLTREPFLISRDFSIVQTARVMAEENISAVLIVDPPEAEEYLEAGNQGQLAGIITDRDLCTRVLAREVSPDAPVAEVMSTDLVVLQHNAYVFEAMLTMLRHNVQHLPILRGGYPIGVIGMTDLVRYESQNSLLLVNSIFQQSSVEELASLAEQVKETFVRLVEEDANSQMVGGAMAEIGRSFVQRLCELAEAAFGEPPVPYCFLALGSMARDEMLVVTDQDNALILDEEYRLEDHGDYFAKLADFVCDGLAACGYSHCTGGIMASNPEWRKTRADWERCFADWIDDPKPQALLNSSIFFDLDGVWGRLKWAEQLNSFIARRARRNNRFLACLARNALNRTPPLGFFKEFVMEKDGRHRDSINLKRRGTALLVDIIRVHALAAGSRAQNSFARLEEVIAAEVLPKGKGPDLRDALEFISVVRIRNQAWDIREGNEPDNSIEPAGLSDFERRHLKDAFQVLSNAQNFLKYRYHANRMSSPK